MTWIFIPEQSVSPLINSKRLRQATAYKLSNLDSNTSNVLTLDDNSCLSILKLDGGSLLIAAWSGGNFDQLAPVKQRLLAIWNEAGQSTITTLPEEELPFAIERVCLLASRLWTNTPFPESWTPKKVSDFQSIFLSSRLQDVRVAYSPQNIGKNLHLIVGTIFYAYRQEKRIQAPTLEADDIENFPSNVTRPAEKPDNGKAGTYLSEDPDVLINRGRGEDRHLFSMSWSDWMDTDSPLTTQQRRIINDKKCPLRIHGPGGSGKTLVLILKALGLLNAASVEDSPCKVLMILHNNEVRNNVRAAIEAIDERGFLATTKEDKQFLDVETLHSWCMRELKIDTGGLDYALHADTIASKRKQDELLTTVVNDAVQERLSKMGGLLSQDLRSHFSGPKERLVANMRYEIAIRIKGRGMRNEQQLYVSSPVKSFVGRSENRHDRYFIFKIAEEYEKELQKAGRLDTDDVVLSMQSRLAAPLWNRQRKTAGYDFVFVDETHLFNENERRVLPYLTRGSQEHAPIIMAFDEAQSIGGRRANELEEVGIHNSGQRRLSYVHRSSPQIYRLARDLIERSSLMFTEFSDSESMARMSDRDLKKCKPPTVVFVDGPLGISTTAVDMAIQLRTKNYQRIGIIAFEGALIDSIAQKFAEKNKEGQIVRERGDSIAGKPFPGIFVMTAENCGGLEFDAVILAGVDNGQVPPSLHNISIEGHLSVREEACKELYTALTRARYHVAFVCDRNRGASEFVAPWIDAGIVEEKKPPT
jgi:superfamily I DNA/RNA helicase